MSVEIFKLNDDCSVSSKFIEARSLKRFKNAGWSGAYPEKQDDESVKSVEQRQHIENTSKVNFSEDEIRALAKAKGISHYHVKGIETLKKELGI